MQQYISTMSAIICFYGALMFTQKHANTLKTNKKMKQQLILSGDEQQIYI